MKHLLFSLLGALLINVLLTVLLCAQTTSIKLSSSDSTSDFRIMPYLGSTILKLNADGGFYVSGNTTTGAIPATGSGARLMWYPEKEAFRAGSVTSSHWNDENIGEYSMALGYNTTANGLYSLSTGSNTTASGTASTAMGNNNTAAGNYSFATGTSTRANGNYSIATGYHNLASGIAATALGYEDTANTDYSTAIGYSNYAGGTASIAMGYNNNASGSSSIAIGASNDAVSNSVAIGYLVHATGYYSTAMGNFVTTNNYQGAFIIGDYSFGGAGSSSANNEMTMRFEGGYRLFTNSYCTAGVYMLEGDGSWRSVSDRNKKENFRPVDGEQILEKIRTIPITEWNYKVQDPSMRYIGPVAQDFYSAFHLSGTDSLGISSLCIDGVNMAAIQALEKRTSELQKANEKIAKLENQLLQQKTEQEKTNTMLIERIGKLSDMITSSKTNNNSQITNNK